jgi:hypothetical protein
MLAVKVATPCRCGSHVGGLSSPFFRQDTQMASGRYSRCPAGDLAHKLLALPIVKPSVYTSVPDVHISREGAVMSNAGISPIDLLWMDHRPLRAPTSTTYEHWVAAGKPCLRHTCGHRHGNHIPSEGMECNECDCLGFVGFAHSADSVATPAIRSLRYPNRRRRKCPGAQQGLSPPTDPSPTGSPLSRKCPDHDRHSC